MGKKETFWGLLRVILGLLESGLYSVTIFGWPGYVYIFTEEGFYGYLCIRAEDNCTARDTGEVTSVVGQCGSFRNNSTTQDSIGQRVNVRVNNCPEQEEMINLIFTVTLAGFATIPVLGYIYDHCGTLFTRILCITLSVGGMCLMGFAERGSEWLLYPGTLIHSVASLQLAITDAQIAVLFPKAQATLVCLVSGAMDVSGFAPVLLKMAYDAGAEYKTCMLTLAGIILFISSLNTLTLPPRQDDDGNIIHNDCCLNMCKGHKHASDTTESNGPLPAENNPRSTECDNIKAYENPSYSDENADYTVVGEKNNENGEEVLTNLEINDTSDLQDDPRSTSESAAESAQDEIKISVQANAGKEGMGENRNVGYQSELSEKTVDGDNNNPKKRSSSCGHPEPHDTSVVSERSLSPPRDTQRRLSVCSLERHTDKCIEVPEKQEEDVRADGKKIGPLRSTFLLMKEAKFWWLLLYFISQQMILLTYQGGFNAIINYHGKNDKTIVSTYTDVYSWFQVTSILWALLAGVILDRQIAGVNKDEKERRFIVPFFVTILVGLVVSVACIIPVIEMQFVAIPFCSMMKTWSFAAHMTFIAIAFPNEQFGVAYSLQIAIANIMSFLEFSIFSWYKSGLGSNPLWLGVLFLGFCVVSSSLPTYLIWKRFRLRSSSGENSL